MKMSNLPELSRHSPAVETDRWLKPFAMESTKVKTDTVKGFSGVA